MHLNSFMCFLCVSSGCLLEVMNGNVSQLCHTVLFHMSPQRTWARACKITLTAFVIFFSSVHTQTFPQIGCPRKGEVTLVLQICLQVDCLRRDKVTLVAFIWLFTSVRFQMSLQIACPRRGIVTLVTLI